MLLHSKNQTGRDTLGGPDPAGPEDELDGPDRGPEDELGGPDRGPEDELGGPDRGPEDEPRRSRPGLGGRAGRPALTAGGIDFPCLLSMLHDSFMSRPNLVVMPGGSRDARPDGIAASIGPFGWPVSDLPHGQVPPRFRQRLDRYHPKPDSGSCQSDRRHVSECTHHFLLSAGSATAARDICIPSRSGQRPCVVPAPGRRRVTVRS